ncbi:MAG TPA: hypothetical protein VJT74_05120 [Pyrinomonadaceae bacterium]|nr:hypothetical protein [Pyrinomonadaceae bacterium]
MAKSFKYRVCQVQAARVTFVNGRWQGLQVGEEAGAAQLYNSCPMVWEYLESAGRDGWELVSVAPHPGAAGAANLMFLKKEAAE